MDESTLTALNHHSTLVHIDSITAVRVHNMKQKDKGAKPTRKQYKPRSVNHERK